MDKKEKELEREIEGIHDKMHRVDVAMGMIGEAYEMIEDVVDDNYMIGQNFDSLLGSGNPHTETLETVLDELQRELDELRKN